MQVRGRVAAVGERSITLETSAEFQFDYLILAPGSTYADNAIKHIGGTVSERQALIEVRTTDCVQGLGTNSRAWIHANSNEWNS